MDRIGKFFKWLFIILGVMTAIVMLDYAFGDNCETGPDASHPKCCEWNPGARGCEPPEEEEEREYGTWKPPARDPEPEPAPIIITNLYLPVFNSYTEVEESDDYSTYTHKGGEGWVHVQGEGEFSVTATYNYPEADAFDAPLLPLTTRRISEEIVWRHEKVEVGIHLLNPHEDKRIVVRCWVTGGYAVTELMPLTSKSLNFADFFDIFGATYKTYVGCESADAFGYMLTEGYSAASFRSEDNNE